MMKIDLVDFLDVEGSSSAPCEGAQMAYAGTSETFDRWSTPFPRCDGCRVHGIDAPDLDPFINDDSLGWEMEEWDYLIPLANQRGYHYTRGRVADSMNPYPWGEGDFWRWCRWRGDVRASRGGPIWCQWGVDWPSSFWGDDTIFDIVFRCLDFKRIGSWSVGQGLQYWLGDDIE